MGSNFLSINRHTRLSCRVDIRTRSDCQLSLRTSWRAVSHHTHVFGRYDKDIGHGCIIAFVVKEIDLLLLDRSGFPLLLSRHGCSRTISDEGCVSGEDSVLLIDLHSPLRQGRRLYISILQLLQPLHSLRAATRGTHDTEFGLRRSGTPRCSHLTHPRNCRWATYRSCGKARY